MKVVLKELCTELREERRGTNELQQQFAKGKATWEMERIELKCLITQVRRPTMAFYSLASQQKFGPATGSCGGSLLNPSIA